MFLMGNVCKYTLEHMDNICKYTKYEQFGIIVIDFLDRDVIACYTKETGIILLYKTKQDNCSKKIFPNGYLGIYKTIYYNPSYYTDGILRSTSCFRVTCGD